MRPEVLKLLRVGLTGGIGSGKSEVARRLAEHGAVLIDADVAAREVVVPGSPGLAQVAAAFGESVLRPDGSPGGVAWPRSGPGPGCQPRPAGSSGWPSPTS